MHSTATEDERQEKTARWWFEAKLAERLLQATQMAKDRNLLRRGARKMQDGKLGEDSGQGESAEDEAINISIGDTHIHNREEQAAPPPQPTPSADNQGNGKASWLKKAAIGAALLAGGAGLGVAASQLLKPDPPAPNATEDKDTDTDTQYILKFSD